MPDTAALQAFTLDATGQLHPLHAERLLLAFPDGRWLELSWDAPSQGHPFPAALAIRGGRMDGVDEAEMISTSSGLAILPLAANLIAVHPYRPSAGTHESSRPASD